VYPAAADEEIAFGLVEGRQREIRGRVGQVRGKRVLRGRVDRKHHELVHLADLGRDRRRRAGVANLPAVVWNVLPKLEMTTVLAASAGDRISDW